MNADHGRRSKLRLTDIAADLRDGHDLGDLAAAWGVAPQTLSVALSTHGWSASGHPMGDRPEPVPVLDFKRGDASWMDGALCAQTDPEVFFPGRGGSTAAAKAICATCDVRDECEEDVLSDPTRTGVWAGMTGAERRKVHKMRGAA